MLRQAYSGFIGLNTSVADLEWHVMKPHEIVEFFTSNPQTLAHFAYPQTVANAFNSPPAFYASDIQQGYGLQLRVIIESNRHLGGCSGITSSLLFPRHYEARDQITFETNAEQGFDEGTCRITSTDFIKRSGSRAKVAKCLLGVNNRPALFLKITYPSGDLVPNAVMFFPDKPSEVSHYPVRFGEAFILLDHLAAVTPDLERAFDHTFSLLVKKSYSDKAGLYRTDTQYDHEQLVVISPKNVNQARSMDF